MDCSPVCAAAKLGAPLTSSAGGCEDVAQADTAAATAKAAKILIALISALLNRSGSRLAPELNTRYTQIQAKFGRILIKTLRIRRVCADRGQFLGRERQPPRLRGAAMLVRPSVITSVIG
jgi:hypothetical protein